MIDKITVGNSTHDISLPLTACSIGNGDALLITDNSNNGKISKTSLVFDNFTANKALTKKGTFEEFVTPSDFLPIKEHCTYHEYVEIGGIKWATKNVGANSITDYGLYFQWGDTQGYTASQVGSGAGQKYFGWEDYKYGNGTSSPGATGMTKYNSTDGKTVLEASDDAVTAAWGGNWRMPTTAEYVALGDAVNSAWTADYQGSGVSGLVLTDKTDSSKVLFFPAAGSCSNGSVDDVGSSGYYWSSSVYSSNVQSAYRLYFNSSHVLWQSRSLRYIGFAVRGVLVDPKADKVSGATNGDIATFNASGNLVDSGKSFPASGNASGASQVVLGNDSRLTDSRIPKSHTHGNITSTGTLQTNDITIENGDKLVVTDSSDSSKIARTSVSFDGSTTSKALTQKGTFETFATTNSTYKLTVNGTDIGGGSTSLGSIYAPTTAGTSGQVLQSNGSGAPTWTTLDIPSGPMTFRGTLGANGTITSIPSSGMQVGDTYTAISNIVYNRFINTGSFNPIRISQNVKLGDMIICTEDNSDYVDLGLPSGTLWGKRNIGASSETVYGYRFIYGQGSAQSIVLGDMYTGTENPLQSSKDTATYSFVSPWHTPTRDLFEELINNTTFEWVTINNINGGKFTAANGNYIFLPANGYVDSAGNESGVGSVCRYWTSTPFENIETDAYLYFYSTSSPEISNTCYADSRDQLFSIRPVVDTLLKQWTIIPSGNESIITYSLGVGTGSNSNKIRLTPSSGSVLYIIVPYATNAGTVNGKTVGTNVPVNAVFTNKVAVNGGTALSYVTTGEKYIWNNKQDALTFETTPSSTNKVATMTELTVECMNNNGHDYVDLGLPSGTMWATMNVDASSETDYGNFYQYGKGAADYDETSYDNDYSGTENPLDFSVDTARLVWGGDWHMPTQTLINELVANTTYEWTTINNVTGGKFTAQNGNYIFIPAGIAALYDSDPVWNPVCCIWSSTCTSSGYAWSLLMDSNYSTKSIQFKSGIPVRGVIEPGRTEKYATKTEVASAQIQSDWNQTTTTAKDYIKNKPTIPAAQVQSDWNATSGMGVILNKPTIPTIPVSLPARNQIANYTTISANQSNVTTSLTEDGSETKVYYNSDSSAVTVSFASSGLTFVDGNDNMEIPAGGIGEVNFLRVTTSSTTRVFVRSVVSDDSVTVNTVS